MITAFGKFCRKIRIDNGELMKDMAQRLDVSPAFLSAVETGKRNAPDNWADSLLKFYKLTESQITDLKKAFEESKSEVKINLRDKSDSDRKMAMAFAREFTSLNETEKQKILELLNKKRL